MKRLALGVLVVLGIGLFVWKQQDHNPGARTREQMRSADVEQAKKMALAGDGVAATSVALWYGRRGAVEEADKWLSYSVKAMEPKGMGLYAAGLVDGRISPKEPGKQILEALELSDGRQMSGTPIRFSPWAHSPTKGNHPLSKTVNGV